MISDNNATVNIGNLIISGSSQWDVGRNVSRFCNIIHMNGNFLEFKTKDGLADQISLID